MYNITMKFLNKTNIFRIALAFAVFALVSFILPSDGNARRLHLENIPALEKFEPLTEKEFKAKTRFLESRPNNEDTLEYSLSLPKDWGDDTIFKNLETGEEALGQNVLGLVSRYMGPPSLEHERAYFTIDAQKLTYEIGVKNWFINHVLVNGLSLLGVDVKNKRELEALYVEVKRDTTYVVRIKVIINGSNIIAARYYVPQAMYDKNKILQAQVVDSFKLKNIDDSPIESLETHGFLNQSYFDYPPSWDLISEPVKSIDKMQATIHHNTVKNKLDGQIDIKVFNKLSTQSRADVIAKFRKDFSVENYKVDGFIEEVEAEYHKDMTYGAMQAYELNSELSNMIGYELWMSLSENNDYIYLVYMITPSRDEEFYTWARNVETYRLIVKTARRSNGGKNFFEYIK